LTSEEPQNVAGGQGRGHEPRGRYKSVARRTFMRIALLVYSVLFAEGFIRIFDAQAVMPRYITGTAWGVRGNIPYSHYWHHTPEVDVEYRINGQGLRANREYSLQKSPGSCRIGLFGDSFFFGLEADYKDTFGSLLEQRLREGGINAEVLNFAVGGFGTAEMLQTYEKFGFKFNPDIVIFSWEASDFNDNVRSDLYRLQNGRLERANASYLPAVSVQTSLMRYAVYRFVADHSQLYTFVRERFNRIVKQQLIAAQKARLGVPQAGDTDADRAASDDTDIDDVAHRNKIQLSAAILLHAQDEIVSSGREFYVVDIPSRLSRTEFASTIGILPESVRSRIPIVSPLAALIKAARPDLKLYYEKGLGHFTPTGTEILVDETREVLNSSARLAACRGRSATSSAVNVR
jgi:hypothetical protein